MSTYINEDQIKVNLTYKLLFKKLWPYARQNITLLVIALVSVFLMTVFARLLPWAFGQAIEKIIQQKNVDFIFQAAMGYLVLQVLTSAFSLCSHYYFQKFGNRMLYYVREDLFSHVQNLPVQYFNKTPVGRVVVRLTNDVSNLGELFQDGLINVFIETLVMLSIVISMAIISPKLTLICLFLSPIFIYLSYIITEKIKEILRDSKKTLSTLSSFISEILFGSRIVRLYQLQGRAHGKFTALSHEYRDLSIQSIRYYAYLQPVMNLFNAVTISLALYYGGLFTGAEGMTFGLLVTFLMNAQDFIHPIREILEKYQQFQNSLTSAERVFQLLDEKTEMDKSQTTALKPLKGQIEFRSLSFRYEPQLPLVLNNVSVNLKQGQSLALIGKTGSGKSTFISLLQKFYETSENSLFLDDRDIAHLPHHFVRSQVLALQQDPFIFRGSLRDNLTLAQGFNEQLNPNTDVTDATLWTALDKVGMKSKLQKHGYNLDFYLEEKGANISQGEKQLIALARVFIFNPRILILDEATANIDSESEHLIQIAIDEVMKGRTSIIVAHRLSTIKNCDLIGMMSRGLFKLIHKDQIEHEFDPELLV